MNVEHFPAETHRGATMGRRTCKLEVSNDKPRYKESTDAYVFFLENWDKTDMQEKQQARVLLLDESERIKGFVILGSKNITPVHLENLRKCFLRANASSIILAQNEAGRNIVPSDDEENIYKHIKKLAQDMLMPVRDAIRMNRREFFSYSENGM